MLGYMWATSALVSEAQTVLLGTGGMSVALRTRKRYAHVCGVTVRDMCQVWEG